MAWFGFLCFCSLRWSLLAYVPNLSSLCALCVLQLILMCVVPTFKMCDPLFLFFLLNGGGSRTLPILSMGSAIKKNLPHKSLTKDTQSNILIERVRTALNDFSRLPLHSKAVFSDPQCLKFFFFFKRTNPF